MVSDGVAAAVYFAACHSHSGDSESDEIWMDVVTGSWQEPEFADHCTMSCRIAADGAGLVDPLVAAEGTADFFGRRLSRDEALVHPRLDEVWEIVDFVVTTDETLAAVLYGTR